MPYWLEVSPLPPETRVWFNADYWAHNAAYDTAFVAGIALAIGTWVWRKRCAWRMVSQRNPMA